MCGARTSGVKMVINNKLGLRCSEPLAKGTQHLRSKLVGLASSRVQAQPVSQIRGG